MISTHNEHLLGTEFYVRHCRPKMNPMEWNSGLWESDRIVKLIEGKSRMMVAEDGKRGK